jgi:hypothetical protein
MLNENESPPKTVAEIGIHIGYIRGDIKDIKASLADTPTRREFDELKTTTNTRLSSKVTRREFTIAGSIVTAVLGFLSFIFNCLKGL